MANIFKSRDEFKKSLQAGWYNQVERNYHKNLSIIELFNNSKKTLTIPFNFKKPYQIKFELPYNHKNNLSNLQNQLNERIKHFRYGYSRRDNVFYHDIDFFPTVTSNLYTKEHQKVRLGLFPPFFMYKLEEMDFSYTYLGGRYLVNLNLPNANLSFCDLYESVLSGSNLPNANLIGANLDGTDIIKSNLRNARFFLSTLYRAKLDQADLSYSNLPKVNLSYSRIIKSKLKKSNMVQVDLKDSQIQRSDLSGVDLRKGNLMSASLTDSNLFDADLRGADLRSTILSNCDLSCADLRGADLREANLTNSNLFGTDLRGANLYRANLTNANLESIIVDSEEGNNYVLI